MKNTKKLSHKHFRYLTKKEFKNPLYAVARICRSETSLYEYRGVINKLMRASSTRTPKKIKTINASNLSFSCFQIMRNIELIYVLKSRFDNWELDRKSPHYHVEFDLLGAWIDDPSLSFDTSLYFKRLKKDEIKNIGIFLAKFFRFKSLRKWYKLIEDIHTTLFSESRLSEYSAYANEDAKIFKYFKKLAEATFLIYETKAKEHIFKHHVKDFYLEEYLEDESTEPTEDDPEENDAAGSTDHDDSLATPESPSPDETADEDEDE